MHSHQRGAVVASILGIVVCGGLGGIAAWAVVTLMGWSGALGAIVAAIIGMVVATALWTAATSLSRTVRRRR